MKFLKILSTDGDFEQSGKQEARVEFRDNRSQFRGTFFKDKYRDNIKPTYFQGILFRDDSINYRRCYMHITP